MTDVSSHPESFAVGHSKNFPALWTEVDITFSPHTFQLLAEEFHYLLGAVRTNRMDIISFFDR
jgi:hypothetical protein